MAGSRTLRRNRRRDRGAATVEFALIVPLLITMLMFSMFLTEIVRVKLKVQEASRYVAWEYTSYILNDYSEKNHQGRWDLATTEILDEAAERFKDLDSVEDNAGHGMVFDFEGLQITTEDQQVPFLQDQIPGLNGGEGIPGASSVLNAFNGGISGLLGAWGFNSNGQVQASVQITAKNKYLPQNYLNGGDGFFTVDQWGGSDLSALNMNSRLTLVANAWNLVDGADAVHRLDQRSTGKHDGWIDDEQHGMHMQVDRMAFMGLKQLIEGVLGGLGDTLQRLLPVNPLATYLVSHNYMKGTRPETRNCGLGRHQGAENGESGLVNQEADPSNILDQGPQRCFDTSPFRDTHAYDQSHYRNIFQARGEWFMGCRNAMADDPTKPTPYSTDEQDNASKQGC